MPFLLVRVADDVIGLAVDRILDRVDIVVKPAGRLVDNMKQYTGATILGDGGIALIVDVPSLQDSLPLGLADRDLDRSEDPESMGTQLHLREERGSHLVFAWREGRWAALPGALVRRVRSLDGARLQRGPDGSRLALGTDIYPVFQPYFLDPGLDPPSLVDTDDSWRALVCSGADGEFVVLASELLGFRPLPDAEPGMEDALRAVLLEDNLVDVLPQALVEAHVPRATLEEVPA